MPVPDSILTIPQLEQFLNQLTKNNTKPFAFRLNAGIEQSKIHLVNLPKGTEVHSPDDTHLGQKNYNLKNEPVELVGFFSKNHKSIFTHHDSFVHIHLITLDRNKMGHLDNLLIKKGTGKFFLPRELTL